MVNFEEAQLRADYATRVSSMPCHLSTALRARWVRRRGSSRPLRPRHRVGPRCWLFPPQPGADFWDPKASVWCCSCPGQRHSWKYLAGCQPRGYWLRRFQQLSSSTSNQTRPFNTWKRRLELKRQCPSTRMMEESLAASTKAASIAIQSVASGDSQ